MKTSKKQGNNSIKQRVNGKHGYLDELKNDLTSLKAGNKQPKMENYKENSQDIIKTLIDLVQQYNYTRELTTNLVGNFNRFDTPTPVERGVDIGGGNPHKLYNKKQNSDFKKCDICEIETDGEVCSCGRVL